MKKKNKKKNSKELTVIKRQNIPSEFSNTVPVIVRIIGNTLGLFQSISELDNIISGKKEHNYE